MNQALCKQTDNMYTCVCGPGWTGKVCDVEMVSCSDAAIRKGEEMCSSVLLVLLCASRAVLTVCFVQV